MKTVELVLPEAAQRDLRLDEKLKRVFDCIDNSLDKLRIVLQQPWDKHSLTGAFIDPDNPVADRTLVVKYPKLNSLSELTVCTGSRGKWKYLEPLIRVANLCPSCMIPTNDEKAMHVFLAAEDDRLNDLSVRIASLKQNHSLPFATMTLDTITVLGNQPMHKPMSVAEIPDLLSQLSGQLVYIETGVFVRIPTISGATVNLLNTSLITFWIKKLNPEDIKDYIVSTPTAINAPAGLDLSTRTTREKFIDMSQPASLQHVNHLNKHSIAMIEGHDLKSILFDAFFSGVPVHAIRALLPMLKPIYLQY